MKTYVHFKYTKYSCDEFGTVYGPRGKPIGSKNPVTQYNTLSVYCNEKQKLIQYRKHRFIMECITGSFIPDGMVINHIDGVKTNNCKSNLEIVTYQQNTQHACQMGLMKPKKGTANGNCDITENEARAILRLLMHTTKTNKQIAEQFNLSDKHISSIRYGLKWKHLLLEEEFKGYVPSKSLQVDDVNKKLVVIHFALTTKLTNHYLGNLLKTDPSNISRIRNSKLYKNILPIYKQESSTTIESLMSPLELVEYRQATGSGVPHNEDDIV